MPNNAADLHQPLQQKLFRSISNKNIATSHSNQSFPGKMKQLRYLYLSHGKNSPAAKLHIQENV